MGLAREFSSDRDELWSPGGIPPDFQRYLGTGHEVCVAPLWSVGRQAHVGSVIHGYKDTKGRWRRAAEVGEVEAALARIASIAAEEKETGSANLIVLPVHYEVIRRPTRFYAFLRRIKELPLDVAKRLTIELVAIPRGHPNHLLLEKVRSLSSSAKQVVLRAYRVEDLGTRIRAIGIRSVTFDFDSIGALGHGQREKRLVGIIACAHRLKLTTLVFGVGSLHGLTTCLAAGVDFVSGPATSIPGLKFSGGQVIPAGALYKAIAARFASHELV